MAGFSKALRGYKFFSGTQLASNVPDLFPIAVNGRSYLIDVRQYRRRTISQLRPPSDQSNEPGEQSFNTEGLWRRSQSDWSFGAGQRFFDVPTSDRRRFQASKGVDVWEPNELSLLPAMEALRANTGTPLFASTSANGFYSTKNPGLERTTNPFAAVPVYADVTGLPANFVRQLATDGVNVYAAVDGNGIYKVVGTAATALSLAGVTVTALDFCNGRLIAGVGNILYDIAAAGATTIIRTLPFTSQTWGGATGAPNGIYAWATAGDQSDIYVIGTDNAGALTVPIVAASLPRGETVQTMRFYGGLFIIGTSRGLRLARVGAAGALSYGPLVKTNADRGGVRALDVVGQFCYFTWAYTDELSGITDAGLGRADLSTFTNELVPAFATDVMTGVDGTPNDVSTFVGYDADGELRPRLIVGINGVGAYRESDNLVASGYVRSGVIRYSTFERKLFTTFELRHRPLAGRVQIEGITERVVQTTIGESELAGSVGPEIFLMAGFDGEQIEIVMTLERDAVAPTTGPTVDRWTLRALPTPSVVDEIVLPIIMHSVVGAGWDEGVPTPFETSAEYQAFQRLVASKEVVRYQEFNNSYDVYVSAVEVQPVAFNVDHTFFDALLLVRLITISPLG